MTPAGPLTEETEPGFFPEGKVGMSRLLGLGGVSDRTPSAELIGANWEGARPRPSSDGWPYNREPVEGSGERGEVSGGGGQDVEQTLQLN